MSRADLTSEIQTAMAALWETMAKIISVVVSRSVLDLDVEQKKPKMDRGELAMKTIANTVKAINECGLLHSSRSLKVASVQQEVWKDLFSQSSFPQPSQASSTTNNEGISGS